MYNLSSKTQRTAKDNLMDQANALVKNARIKGIKTRVRYLECFDHFAQYYADEWHGQKIANISAKHIYGYAEYMKSNLGTRSLFVPNNHYFQMTNTSKSIGLWGV